MFRRIQLRFLNRPGRSALFVDLHTLSLGQHDHWRRVPICVQLLVYVLIGVASGVVGVLFVKAGPVMELLQLTNQAAH